MGGTALTIKLAKHLRKPCLLIDLSGKPDAQKLCQWLQSNQIRILNVAGPREEEAAGIHDRAAAFLREALGFVTKESW